MLLAFAELRDDIDLVVVSRQHHLRGNESDGDEAFVATCANCSGVPAPTLPTAPSTPRRSAIAAGGGGAGGPIARLHEIARLPMPAHRHRPTSAMTKAETVLMRLHGGGGPAALGGIHPVRADV